MAPRTTRSRAKAPAAKTEAEAVAAASSVTQKKPPRISSKSPPKLLVLPDAASPAARIVTLAHPRTAEPTRYFVCPEKGFYEFTAIAAPKSAPRSWLLTPCSEEQQTSTEAPAPAPAQEQEQVQGGDNEFHSSKGYITSSALLYLATPFDPLFLLLPALAGDPAQGAETKRLFLEADDHLDALSSASPHFRHIRDQPALRATLAARMAAVCDTVDAGDETMYRLSAPKLLAALAQKCEAMVARGLPASMEQKLVRSALEVPLLSVRRADVPRAQSGAETEEDATPRSEGESQSTESAVASASAASTAVTTPAEEPVPVKEPEPEPVKEAESEPVKDAESQPAIEAPDGVPHLLRLRTALGFLCASYIPPRLAATLQQQLGAADSPFPVFEPLDRHLKHLARLREEALAARALGDSFSRKRGGEEGEGESRAEKKRRVEEEEKARKKSESKGVRELKKVNTSGMKKMSDFFKKKT